jgi:predicted TIM-barrel fold metal-dependent hydrolase
LLAGHGRAAEKACRSRELHPGATGARLGPFSRALYRVYPRHLFSVDYPFTENLPGTEWLKTLLLGPEDTEKLLNGNAGRLLKI